jgi:sporulation protein YlmC with PRC-barrel domain
MDLVRDVLDKRILDRNGTIIGRVDGLIIDVGDDGQPRVTELSIGGPPVFARIGKWASSLARFLGAHWGPKRGSAVRIPWSKIDHFGRDVKLTIGCEDTEAMAWEDWIDKHIIMKIPGGGSK